MGIKSHNQNVLPNSPSLSFGNLYWFESGDLS